jgi:hypothetical protein
MDSSLLYIPSSLLIAVGWECAWHCHAWQGGIFVEAVEDGWFCYSIEVIIILYIIILIFLYITTYFGAFLGCVPPPVTHRIFLPPCKAYILLLFSPWHVTCYASFMVGVCLQKLDFALVWKTGHGAIFFVLKWWCVSGVKNSENSLERLKMPKFGILWWFLPPRFRWCENNFVSLYLVRKYTKKLKF